ncbi:PfkB family carbohydrate kinase [Candidatus Nitrosocosmicus franklandus]|uniref:Putative sugar kinase YdjH n=1 Tax=Candidatus Nitrosocosmicus franklandianus TaxID=1798806 RepID=A0A484IAL5_9ARCH|nr:PfkB family carbohydrate kinase [Candidatus Nitrosocosmicus franklandus]VFJ13055.1 putative sugar kinase YdjH [Candidatus Nitrosocosmicus franklandus]
MLTVFGSVALDTTRTPFETRERILGGAATYASISASFFAPVSLIGVIGNDFPTSYYKMLADRLDLAGLVTSNDKKTFFYDSSFDYDLSHRTTNITELNAIENFEPPVPSEYVDSRFVYLANNDPDQNIKIIDKFKKPELIVCDTIEFWIENKRDAVIRMIQKTHGVVINDQEARLLCNTSNLVKCGKQLLSYGPKFIIIKKGEHGVLFFFKDNIIPIPGYPLESVVDPTGAGDSFAGGFMGYLVSNRTSGDFLHDLTLMKESILMGSVMGTFAIEAFGTDRLFEINKMNILNRFDLYRKMLSI